jgi:hypothetical protein
VSRALRNRSVFLLEAFQRSDLAVNGEMRAENVTRDGFFLYRDGLAFRAGTLFGDAAVLDCQFYLKQVWLASSGSARCGTKRSMGSTLDRSTAMRQNDYRYSRLPGGALNFDLNLSLI